MLESSNSRIWMGVGNKTKQTPPWAQARKGFFKLIHQVGLGTWCNFQSLSSNWLRPTLIKKAKKSIGQCFLLWEGYMSVTKLICWFIFQHGASWSLCFGVSESLSLVASLPARPMEGQAVGLLMQTQSQLFTGNSQHKNCVPLKSTRLEKYLDLRESQ